MKVKDLFEDTKNYRPLSVIAREIKKDWKNPGYAKPYLDAMLELNKISDKYGADDAQSVVLYFLSNAASWRGEVAKKIKAELKAMAAGKPVKESLVVESAHHGVMQQTIFDFVIKKLKALNANFHSTYAQDLARTTDSFWTEQFDNLHEAINKSTDLDEIEDELKKTIETVSNVICDYFADEMNHPTGFKSRRMQGLDYDSATQEEIDGLIKKIDPQLKKELEQRDEY